MKQNLSMGPSKKQNKDLTFKSVDVEKYFAERETKIARPRVYPQMEISVNNEDNLMPEVGSEEEERSSKAKNGKQE